MSSLKFLEEYRVIIVIPTLRTGGAERQVRNLVEWLNRYGNRPYILSRDASEVCDVQAELISIPNVGGVSIKSLLVINKVQKILGEKVITLSFLRQANVLVGLLRLFKKFHWMSSERSNPYLESGSYVFLERVLKRNSLVVANSEGAVRFYRSRFFRAELLPNIVDHNSYTQAISEKKYVVLCRLIKDKKVDFILDAWAIAGLDAQLIIIGDGPEKIALQLKIRNLGLDNVTFKGHLENPLLVLRSSTFYISASLREGMPNAALEAANSHNILLLNDIESHKDLIAGTSHLLYETDSLESLVENLKLSYDLGEKERLQILSCNYEILEKHRPEKVLEKLDKIFCDYVS